MERYFLIGTTIFFCNAVCGMYYQPYRCITVVNTLDNKIMLYCRRPDPGFLGSHVLTTETTILNAGKAERIMISTKYPPTTYTLIKNNISAHNESKTALEIVELPKENNGVIIIK